jgi:predicted NBD/HSP70 family sugar kinase
MLEDLGKKPIRAVSRASSTRRAPAVPADVRVGNLLRVLRTLREAETLSRSDLARLTSLGVPTVHRLILDLLALGLITEIPARQDGGQKGRPAVMYQQRDLGVVVVGVDVGNETTRFALASASGRILASHQIRSSAVRRDLVAGIASGIEALLAGHNVALGTLAGIGIGVAAAVHPARGTLQNPPRHRNWQGLELGKLVQERLGCPALVQQDDHFAAIAEASSVGTFPGANSLLVLEIGTGIGAAMMVDGASVVGAHGRFGRIASWPVTTPRRGVAKSTLGVSLVAGGLVEDYHRREGRRPVRDGASLFAAAADGDLVADAVLAWAGREIAELVIRLHRFCDPDGIVFGGGLAGGFATLEPHLRPHLPADIVLASSVLRENTVLIGAILSSLPFADAWVNQRLSEFDAEDRANRGHLSLTEFVP